MAASFYFLEVLVLVPTRREHQLFFLGLLGFKAGVIQSIATIFFRKHSDKMLERISYGGANISHQDLFAFFNDCTLFVCNEAENDSLSVLDSGNDALSLCLDISKIKDCNWDCRPHKPLPSLHGFSLGYFSNRNETGTTVYQSSLQPCALCPQTESLQDPASVSTKGLAVP